MKFRMFGLTFLTILVSVSLSVAQVSDTGVFVGTVLDTEGTKLPGVVIIVKGEQTSLTQSTVTNQQGFYRIERIPRGVYTLTASIEGFKTLNKTGVKLLAGDELKIDFVLEVGTIQEEVNVIGEAPVVETTRAQISTVISEKEILAYPQGNRNFMSLIQFTPGSQPDAGSSGWSINGMRGSSNNQMLDGIYNNDNTNATNPGAGLPLEAIQEFRLISSNFSTEYGRNSGGTLNVVMKSGTNELHGSGWLFYRGDSALFRSEDWLTHDRPPYKRYQYGGTLGGPIIKDKTFFFLSFEGVKQDIESRTPMRFFTPEARAQAQGVARQIFDALPDYPTPTYNFIDYDMDGTDDAGWYIWDGTSHTRNYTVSIKIDHIFSEKNRIALRWVYNNMDQYSDFAYVPGHETRSPWTYHTGGLTWLHLFSPTAYNEVRIGYHYDYNNNDRVMGDLPTFSIIGVGQIGDWTQNPKKYKNHTYQLADVFNFQKGNHSIKLGFEARLWRSDSNWAPLVAGWYYYLYPMDFIRGNPAYLLMIGANPPDPEPGNPYLPGDPSGEWLPSDPERIFQGFEGGIFVQDDWRVNKRLTLSFGLRWEYFGVPTEESGRGINNPAFGTKQGFESMQIIEGEYNREGIRYLMFDGRELLGEGLWDPYYLAFSPKFSFAYDLTGDGKTALRGGFGIAYDRTFNEVYENDRFNYPDHNVTYVYGHYFGLPPIYATWPATIPQANISSVSPSLRWLLPDLKPQMAINFLVGIQREISPGTAVEFNYSASLGRRLGTLQRPNRFTGDGLDGTYDGINPYVSIGGTNSREQSLRSNYHSLQIIITRRFSNGWSLFTSYTLGRARDMNSDYMGDISGMERVCHDLPEMEWGIASFDHTHRFVGGIVWDVPYFKNSNNWILKNIIAGWQFSSTFNYTSGRAFSVESYQPTDDYNLDGDYHDRPLWLGGDPSDVIKWDTNGYPYLDESLFGTPNPPMAADDFSYYNQNFVERNLFRWFPTYNIDVSLTKYFTVSMGARDITIQVIGEIFNLLKNTFWNLPNSGIGTDNFGQVLRKSGDRTAQCSVRILF
jgi:hypothetical protein